MEGSPRARSNGSLKRSTSPSGRFCSSSISSSSSAFASSLSSFSARSTGLLTRPASPTRVNLRGSGSSSPSVRFSIDRPTSPSRSISAVNQSQSNRKALPAGQKKTCMCSPTTHPGSFRCSLHKNASGRHHQAPHQRQAASYRLNARRSAMTNSLVRIGTVEGDLVKRALAALIRPSSHQQRRRGDFQRRPSRLSIMSRAEDL
ncbi:uncharacterized protein LOC127789609 [Diospyros lotus]|uniref:uncharacterized protein LOC127789609 n=1 Tax=Diospyros lotus TaxID=55363 RepID=UPI002258DA82|nr:uncharacterized protein LOC127789609 [Diospyros lotus]XP_052174503.1 uncharacterized protein LOC127789609 [Diospyros lotus]XP_052174504.1 uncharacterized protein LOC127789609 [Diospyros lotus]